MALKVRVPQIPIFFLGLLLKLLSKENRPGTFFHFLETTVGIIRLVYQRRLPLSLNDQTVLIACIQRHFKEIDLILLLISPSRIPFCF